MDNAQLIAEARGLARYNWPIQRERFEALADALEAAEAELTRRQAVIDEARTANHFSPIKNYRVEEILAAAPVSLEAMKAETTTDRHALETAIGAVVWNASNHPTPSAVMGRDISPLRSKLVDAVLAAGFGRSQPPGAKTAQAETRTEWAATSPWSVVTLPTEAEARSWTDSHGGFRVSSREVTEWRPVPEPGDS